jgi:hypothetical protein
MPRGIIVLAALVATAALVVPTVSQARSAQSVDGAAVALPA